MSENNPFNHPTMPMGGVPEPQGLLEQFNLPPALIAFLRKNSKTIWIIIGCVSLVVVAVSLYGSYRTYTLNKAGAALDDALQAQENKESLLKNVAAEYSSTPSATWAQVELANVYVEQGELDKAVTILVALQSDTGIDELIKPLVTFKLAGLYEQQEQMEKALGTYTVLSGTAGFEAAAYKAMGRIQEHLGNEDQAIAMYTKYLEQLNLSGGENQSDPAKIIVEARVKQLKSKQE